MPARIVRIIIGLLGLVAALPPGAMAILLLVGLISPAPAPHMTMISQSVEVAGHSFQGPAVYGVTAVATLIASLLAGGSLWLMISNPHKRD